MGSIFRNYGGGDYGSLGNGEDELYDYEDPYAGLLKTAWKSPSLNPGGARSYSSIAGGTSGAYLKRLAPILGNQFLLRSALNNNSVGTGAYKQYTRDAVQGLYGDGASAYASSGEVGDIAGELRGLFDEAMDTKSNVVGSTFREMAKAAPRDFVEAVAALYQPHLGGRLGTTFQNMLLNRLEEARLSDPKAYTDRFAQDLLAGLGGFNSGPRQR
jgi:hypothetical protein